MADSSSMLEDPEAAQGSMLDPDSVIYAFRRNIVVAASAGTGKTYRLTALYVLLTLGLTSMGESSSRSAAPAIGPDRIVATTFSRAAAQEIATRVERVLTDIAAWDGSSPLALGAVLLARQEALGEHLTAGELKKRAASARARFGSAQIDTLHGVASRIVHRHALAIGLSPSARILEEEEAQALGDLAVDEVLSVALSSGGDPADAARALIVSCGGVAQARRQILRLLDRLDEEGLAPRDLRLPDHMAEGRMIASSIHKIARDAASLGSPTFREAAAALTAHLGRATPGGPLLPEAAIASLTDLLTRRMPARNKRLPADDALCEFTEGLQGKNKADCAAGLIALLRHSPALAAREAGMVTLLDETKSRLGAEKRRVGGLGFGDLLRLARDTLRDRPEIARAVRDDIDVLLVDEFQDTSRVQRDIVYLLREREDAAAVRPLGDAPLATGLLGHGLFLVGDRKQSIYGFRGADVAVFSRIAADLAGRAAGEALSLPPSVWASTEPSIPSIADFIALRESRRSGPRVLEFVNAFSARDFLGDRVAGQSPRDFEITYGPAEHLVPAPGNEAKPASVVLLEDDGITPEEADPIVRDASGSAREAHVAAAFVAKIAQIAKKPGPAKADAPPVAATNTAGTPPVADPTAAGESPVVAAKLAEGLPPMATFDFKQIAILARRRSTIPLIELALARLDIPYVVAGRALYDAPEVRDLAALLRLLLDPRDRLSLATVLRGPAVALSDSSLVHLCVPGRGLSSPLVTAERPSPDRIRVPELLPIPEPADDIDLSRLPLTERARLDLFRTRYAEVRRAALRLAPGEALRAVMTAFDVDRVLAALPRADARIGNLDRLVTIARRRGGSLAAFVRWLEGRIRDEADEAEAAVFSAEDNAVRLTTIHASKGLDFPVVILVDLNAEPRADAGSLGFVLGDNGAAPTLSVRHFIAREDTGVLSPLQTATLKQAQIDARARERAERRRLSYVAITRASHTLALVAVAAKPRGGSAMRSLADGLEQGDLIDVVTSTESATALLADARSAPPPARPNPTAAARPPPRPAGSPARVVALPVLSAGLFWGCPRRFRLRHLVGLEEPAPTPQLDLFAAAGPVAAAPTDVPPPLADDPALDPRPRGREAEEVFARWPLAAFGAPTDPAAVAARLVALGLSAEDPETAASARGVARALGSPYARAIREDATTVTRALAFMVPIALPEGPALHLEGTVDLRVAMPDRIDVLAVDAAPPSLDSSLTLTLDPTGRALALRAAALSVARANPDVSVRAGQISLAGSGDPTWIAGTGKEGSLSPADLASLETGLTSLAQRFTEARYDDKFPGVPVTTCKKLQCGFLSACHGGKGR